MESCEIGQRVKVTNGYDRAVNERGTVVEDSWKLGATREADIQQVKVLLDGAAKPTEFSPGDLELITVRVVEGRVDEQGFIMEGPLCGPATAFMRVGKEYRGKWLRVTVEELDWPATAEETEPAL